MTTAEDNVAAVPGWQRKPGPPRVWRVVEGRKKTADERTLGFSIQEIPKNRYEDVLDHMTTVFARDEPLCANDVADLLNDPEAFLDVRKIWSFALDQGIVVGAFLVDEGNPKPPLVGANMTLVKSAVVERAMKRAIQLNSETMRRTTRFLAGLEEEMDVRRLYDVEEYITAFGLSVDPRFRGLGIAYHLLRARDDMSAAYDLRATSTLFSAASAQKAAERAGFDLLIERDFSDVRNEDGAELFPSIPAERCKLMGKRFVAESRTDER